MDYVSSAPDPQFFVAHNTDLPIPELDSIGMQSIPISMYSNSDSELSPGFASSDYTMGYLPRYYSWKTSYDYVYVDVKKIVARPNGTRVPYADIYYD